MTTKQLTLTDPEARRKAALEALPRCEIAMNLEGRKQVPNFIAYRKAYLLSQAAKKVLK